MEKIIGHRLQEIQELNQKAWVLRKKDRQGALRLALQAQSLLSNCAQAQPIDEFDCLKTQVYCLDRLGKPTEALAIGLRANVLAEQINDNFLISTAQGLLGRIFWHIDDFPTALDCFLKGLKLVQTEIHAELEISLVNGLGLVQFGLGDYSEALRHFLSCQEMADKNDPTSLGDANNNIAYVLHMMGRDQEALQYGEQALTMQNQFGTTGGIMEALHTLGAIHITLGNHDQAMRLLTDGLQLSRHRDSQLLEVTFSLEIGRLLKITGDLDQAEKMGLLALDIAVRISSLSNASNIHRHLADIYEEKLNLKSALYHFRAFHASHVKIYNEKSDQRVRVLEILHQLEVTRKQAGLYRELAGTDLLTNLINRRGLMENLNQAISRSKRQNSYGAVLFLDLNRFKQLNDSHGHSAGDRLLVLVAGRLKAAVRTTDTVARLGGDEFVVLLEGLGTDPLTASESAGALAKKIRQILNEEYELGDIVYCTSASIGIKHFIGDGVSVDQILKDADAAMYADKRLRMPMRESSTKLADNQDNRFLPIAERASDDHDKRGLG